MKERGRRFLSPEVGRWINRDPIEEEGGLNLFVLSRNTPVSAVDILGLAPDFRDPEWHHRFVDKFRWFFERHGIRIDDAEYGLILEKNIHSELTRKFEAAWDNAINVEWKDVEEITPDMIRDKLKVIERDFQPLLKTGIEAPMSYGRWGKGRYLFLKGLGGDVMKVGGRWIRVLTVGFVITAYNDAIAAGRSIPDAMNEASWELVNPSPWTVREIVTRYELSGKHEVILKESIRARRNLSEMRAPPGMEIFTQGSMEAEILSEKCGK